MPSNGIINDGKINKVDFEYELFHFPTVSKSVEGNRGKYFWKRHYNSLLINVSTVSVNRKGGAIMNHHQLTDGVPLPGHDRNIKLIYMLTCNFFLHANIESFE